MTTTPSTAPGPAGADRTQLAASLRALRLSGMLDSLENRLAQAAEGQLGFLDFLQALCLDEINRRDSAALERRTRAAKFETDGRIENFDFTADPGIPAARIRDLANAEWVRTGQHVIISGPGVIRRLDTKMDCSCWSRRC